MSVVSDAVPRQVAESPFEYALRQADEEWQVYQERYESWGKLPPPDDGPTWEELAARHEDKDEITVPRTHYVAHIFRHGGGDEVGVIAVQVESGEGFQAIWDRIEAAVREWCAANNYARDECGYWF